MSHTGNYPVINTPDEVPYLINLKEKLLYAKDYAPHKVAYYEQLIKEWGSLPFINLNKPKNQ